MLYLCRWQLRAKVPGNIRVSTGDGQGRPHSSEAFFFGIQGPAGSFTPRSDFFENS